MIKVLNIRYTGDWKLELEFSDHTHGLFDADTYLANRKGPLLDALREPNYFKRAFVDAGAVCWPNGLELSAARLRELAKSGVDV
ncbi:MAG: hypothetical protein RLZZ352_111 [Pseudomonadota bacterium]